jgi:hypothetical protein
LAKHAYIPNNQRFLPHSLTLLTHTRRRRALAHRRRDRARAHTHAAPAPASRRRASRAHLPELATAVHTELQHLRPSSRARGESPLLLPLSWLLFPVNARQAPPRVSSPPRCPRSMPNQLHRGRVGAHGATARCQRRRHSPARVVRRSAPPPVRPCPCRSVLAWLTLRRGQHSPARAPCGLRSTPHSPRAFVRRVSAPSQRAVGVSTTFVYP